MALIKEVWGFIKWILRLDKKQNPSPSDPAASGGDATTISQVTGPVVQAETVSIYQQPQPQQTTQVPPGSATSAPDLTSWIGRPVSIGEAFLGRETQMEALGEALEQRRAVVLSGGAGTGKSRLAAEHTHSWGTRGFWTAGGETVDRTLAALATFLPIRIEGRSDEEIAGEVRRTLPTLPGDTVWVVDNLGDLGLVNGLAGAAGPLKLVITTRDARRNLLPPNVAYLEVPTLDPEASYALLCSRSNCKPDDPILRDIAEAVGNLPLALEQLAVRLGAPLQTPQGMLDELQQAPTRIEIEAFREAAGSTVERPEGVFVTIAGTLAGLGAEHRRALEPLGYLADTPAPIRLVAALTGLEQEALGRLLEECLRQSVLSVAEDTVEVHALTAAAIAATNPQGSLMKAITHYNHRLDSINVDDPVALRGELAHHEAIHSQVAKTLGVEDPSVLGFVNNLAIGYSVLGRAQEAVDLGKRALEIRERVLGPEHPDTLSSQSNLAIGYRALGRAQEAVELDEKTLEIIERVLGPEHPDTLTSRNGLANGYRDLGRIREAVELDFEDPGDHGAGPGAGAPRHPLQPQQPCRRLQGPWAGPGGGGAGREDPRDKEPGTGAGAPRHPLQPQQPCRRLQGPWAGPGGGGAGREDPRDKEPGTGARALQHPRQPQQPGQRLQGPGTA